MNRNMNTKGLKAEDTHSQAETLPSSVFTALHQMSDSQAKTYKAREELRKKLHPQDSNNLCDKTQLWYRY